MFRYVLLLAVSGRLAIPQVAREDLLKEFLDLLSIPNISTDTDNIRRNAEAIQRMFERRGVSTRLLGHAGAPPVVYGELLSPGARRTLMFYAH
jgi:hypothetical protein